MSIDLKECIVNKLRYELSIETSSIEELLSMVSEKIAAFKFDNPNGKFNHQIRRLEFLRNEACIVHGLGLWQWHG